MLWPKYSYVLWYVFLEISKKSYEKFPNLIRIPLFKLWFSWKTEIEPTAGQLARVKYTKLNKLSQVWFKESRRVEAYTKF